MMDYLRSELNVNKMNAIYIFQLGYVSRDNPVGISYGIRLEYSVIFLPIGQLSMFSSSRHDPTVAANVHKAYGDRNDQAQIWYIRNTSGKDYIMESRNNTNGVTLWIHAHLGSSGKRKYSM